MYLICPHKGQCDIVEYSVESVQKRRGWLRLIDTEAALTTSLYDYVTL